MNFDGEWRVAFIHNEHPNLDYGTAPMPVDDAHPELYGSGYINGTIIGIPRGVKHQDQAWALVKYLTTNNHSARAVSRTGSATCRRRRARCTRRRSSPDAHFTTFLKIFANPKSGTSPILASGQAYTNAVQNFFQQWQAGKVKDLHGGLEEARASSSTPRSPRPRAAAGCRERVGSSARRAAVGRPGAGRAAAHARAAARPTGVAAGSCCS